MRWCTAFAALLSVGLAPSQTWAETCGRSPAGVVALQQAAVDAGCDALVLVVASHPDDRYVLPAVWMSYRYGARVAVLMATRGGGGQNTVGPESGDALERIRTLETEAGCARFGGQVWYLDRPDGGFRRTAEETFAEWGREQTLHDLVGLIRRIRPDVVLTTHNEQESHGHDVALLQLLLQAVPLAGDVAYRCDGAPHAVHTFAIGANAPAPGVVAVPMDRIDPLRGDTYRQIAYSILAEAHVTPGPPSPLDSVFAPDLAMELRVRATGEGTPIGTLPSVFDPEHWTGDPKRAEALSRFLTTELPAAVVRREGRAEAIQALGELRALALAAAPGSDTAVRLARRIDALERVVANLSGLRIALDLSDGTSAVEGEEFQAMVQVNVDEARPIHVTVEGLDGVVAGFDLDSGVALDLPNGGAVRAQLSMRLPVRNEDVDPMGARFHAERFLPPVRVRFLIEMQDVRLPIDLTVPVEERAPVEVAVVPRMLLLPESRRELQFSVNVVRNSRLPVETELEVRAPAGYAIRDDRRPVVLRDRRSDLFGFEVAPPEGRRPGVDVLRISVAGMSVALPVHKVDVEVPPALRVGVLRSRDDSLTGILGVGGLGLAWSELSDADIAAGQLSSFDTIVVDVRALRDRPLARRGFGRLLEFARGKGHRLVVFYHKDFEFSPPREGFQGAPYQLQIGKNRVTRADAPVRILLPEHPLLNHPNKLRPWDWDGWEQERALYLPAAYGGQFEELLEVHDPGQIQERGALLYARTGDGEYVYCALALWRQLKKLHPGAVRLLANLLTPSGNG